jgi:exodeoxyribonuclease V alpha subunit
VKSPVVGTVKSESARFQGSDYPCVVIPLITSAWMMLQRNLLYTAVTRAKQLVVLVGSPRALGQAVRATGSGRRHTALAHRLRGGAGRTGSAVSPVAVGTARG